MKLVLSACKLSLLVIGLLLIGSIAAVAQSAATGTINGTVTDSSGAAIPGAKVVIVDTDTSVSRAVTTNSDGTYTAPFLQSGHYEVTVEAPNFAKVDHKNLSLTVGQILAVDSTLPAGSVSTEVIVTTAGPLLDTEKTEVSQTVPQVYVANLPVNSRRWDSFVLLSPNVAPDGNSGFVSYRGVNGLYNTNLVDGVSNQQLLFAEARGRSTLSPYVYSPDSVKEFDASISGYSAELGGAAGGVVNAVTKSGANQLHGDLFYDLRYPTLNALDPYAKWFATLQTNPAVKQAYLSPTIHQQQQFGGSVGGAIRKDKLFYFFTYDGFRRAGPILYVPGQLPSVFDTYATSSSNCPAPLTFDECASALDYLVAQQNGNFGRNLKQDIFFPRLDWQATQSDHFSVSYLWDDYKQPNVYNGASVVVTSSGIGTNAGYFVHERFLVGSWDHLLSSSSANSFKWQWSRDLETSNSNQAGPNVGITGFAAYGEATGVPRIAEPDEHRLQFFDVYTKTAGKHTWKAGADLNFVHEVMIQLFQGDGTYSYSSFANWVQDVYQDGGNGKHYSSFNQGFDSAGTTGSSATVGVGHGKDDFWMKNLSGFVEDQWKALPKLTLNIGIRYDTQLIPQPPVPYTQNFSNVPSPLGVKYTTNIPINYTMFQPRIGFAWNPKPGTVVRGGYGMFYGLAPGSEYYNVRAENGSFQGTYSASPTTTGAPSFLGTFFTPQTGFGGAPFACNTTSFAKYGGVGSGGGCPHAVSVSSATGKLPTGALISLHGMDPSFTPPHTHSMDFGIEQQFGQLTSLSLGYVGTRAMRLPFAPDLNLAPWTGTTRSYDVVDALGVTQSVVTVPYYPATAVRPDASLTNLSVIRSVLNTWYNAFSVGVKRQTRWGVQGFLNYTWSHAQDEGQVSAATGGTFFGTDIVLDPYNVKERYGNPAINMSREAASSDIDMRERFVGSLVYNSSFNLSNSLARSLATGWIVSGTATEQTGFPVTGLAFNNPIACPGCSGAPAGPQDGSATGGGDNTNNLPSTAYGRVPSVRRNGFPGPGVRNIDMRIGRDFNLPWEGLKLQVTAEAFNIVNHRNGLAVATTFSSYINPGQYAANTTGAGNACPASHVNTCIVPYVNANTTGLSANTSTPFGTINSTSSTLYGPRQLQLGAKLFF
jgi:Carboxypeptidase regulatory-like domain/TonB dependent receptor